MEKFLEIVTKVNGALNSFAWGPIMLLLLVGSGIYLSIRTGFIQVGKFGYIMKNTVGSLFRKDGKKVRIVSVPSEGLFRQQPKEYQQSVLPQGVKKFGLTAGLPVNLLGLVPEAEGTIWGLESFGFSAPYKVLDEKLGYTAENVYAQVNKLF